MENENYEVVDETEEVVIDAKPTFKEKLKKVPVKKILKVGAIIAGSIAGTIILGKIATPDESEWQDDEVPFDGDAVTTETDNQ